MSQSKTGQVIKGYHYTTQNEKILTEGLLPNTSYIDLHSDFSELLKKAGIDSSASDFLELPRGVLNKTIKCLLQPEPDSWKKNPKYPDLWKRLMFGVFHYSPHLDWPVTIDPTEQLFLFEIDLVNRDRAYVLEEDHMREIHHFELPIDIRKRKRQVSESLYYRKRANQIRRSLRRYWDSRVPVFEYRDQYKLPILTIESVIPCDRLRVHSVMSARNIEEISSCVGGE